MQPKKWVHKYIIYRDREGNRTKVTFDSVDEYQAGVYEEMYDLLYLKHQLTWAEAKELTSSFEPYDYETLDDLQEWRINTINLINQYAKTTKKES